MIGTALLGEPFGLRRVAAACIIATGIVLLGVANLPAGGPRAGAGREDGAAPRPAQRALAAAPPAEPRPPGAASLPLVFRGQAWKIRVDSAAAAPPRRGPRARERTG